MIKVIQINMNGIKVYGLFVFGELHAYSENKQELKSIAEDLKQRSLK